MHSLVMPKKKTKEEIEKSTTARRKTNNAHKNFNIWQTNYWQQLKNVTKFTFAFDEIASTMCYSLGIEQFGSVLAFDFRSKDAQQNSKSSIVANHFSMIGKNPSISFLHLKNIITNALCDWWLILLFKKHNTWSIIKFEQHVDRIENGMSRIRWKFERITSLIFFRFNRRRVDCDDFFFASVPAMEPISDQWAIDMHEK